MIDRSDPGPEEDEEKATFSEDPPPPPRRPPPPPPLDGDDNDDDDNDEALLTLLRAYQTAQDEDVLNAQNAMSYQSRHHHRHHSTDGIENGSTGSTNEREVVVMMVVDPTTTPIGTHSTPTSTPSPTDPLMYYVLPYEWFRTLYQTVLSLPHQQQQQQPLPRRSKTWKERVGTIPDISSLTTTSFVSSTAPPPVFLKELQSKLGAKPPLTPTPTPPPPVLQHGRDYILVGSHVWSLLSSQWGHDGPAIACSCVTSSSSDAASRISVRVSFHHHTTTTTTSVEEQRIPLPMTGRFPYEQYMKSPSPPPPPVLLPVDDVTATTTTTTTTTTMVPEERHQQPHSMENVHPRLMHQSTSPATNTPVIRLPPSTTMSTTTTNTNPQDVLDDDNDNDGIPEERLNHIDYNHHKDNNNQYHPNRTNARQENDDDDDDDEDMLEARSTTTVRNVVVTVPVRRKYGSGLGNLGNTCFMNSTLQCLGHTLVLQYYFLSQQYQADLNRYNPLGTGGELATQFAHLLSEMWTTTTIMSTMTTSNLKIEQQEEVIYTTASNVVYPKNFKYTLGKHAAQFMGYDQHDSQELATYLLDALHEDCNRITTKPYIEKPEQTVDETDQQASDKAWELHLQREDSHILEYFMGQVKSRVQCNQRECQRVSTTFDPFMFLSVPIPGSEDRTLQLTWIPMDASLPNVKLSVKLNKMSTMDDVTRKVMELLPEVYDKDAYESSSLCLPQPLSSNDLIICDVWKNEIFDFFQNKDDIEKIRDNDETIVYQLSSLQLIRQREAQLSDETFARSDDAAANHNETEITTTKYKFQEWKRHGQTPNVTATNGSSTGGGGINGSSCSSSKYRIYSLDVGTLTQLNREQEWLRLFQERYMMSPLILVNAYHPKKGSTEEKVRIYRRLAIFLDTLHQSIADDETTSDEHRRNEHGMPKRVRGSLDYATVTASVNIDPKQKISELAECSEEHTMFQNVHTMEDLAILEFISKKMYLDILQSERTMKRKQLQAFPNGVIVEVRIRTSTEYHTFASTIPLVIRLSSSTTIYQFREMIAHRLVRCVKMGSGMKRAAGSNASDDYWSMAPDSSKFAVSQAWDNDIGSSEMDLGNADKTATTSTADAIYQKALNIVCRIPLLYDRKNATSIHNRSNAAPSRSLGSVRTGQQQRYQFQHHSPTVSDEPPLITFAQPSHNEEKELISEIVGNYGIVFVNIPSSFSQDESFDIEAMHSMEVYQPSVPSTSSRGNGGDITVLDCIEKFCQKEQLEESEQWYCSRCKQHVCAWKQFHIYRCPPHLIVHLKRFQFSARTHRRQKINIHVDFPLTGLDLSKQVLHWNNDDEKPIYDCYAVSNHYGGLGGGHYTAYAINDDGVWCHYDDSRITSHISPSEVVSSAAYVLYYRRRDVPVDMEYIQKIVASPQTIITHQQQQDRSYISPYTVIGRDDMSDGVDNMGVNGPLLPHHSEARVMRPETAVVPLFEGDDDDDANNIFEDSATNNFSSNHDALTATDRDDDETGSHSSDDGLPLPSGLRVSSASAVTGAMIIAAEEDEEVDHEEKVANITGYDNDEGTEEFYDTMTATDPVVENDDDERVGNDDEDEDDDDESPTVTATTEGTATRLLPLQ